MICSYAPQPTLPAGEYVVRLHKHSINQRSRSTEQVLEAEILEGRHDGRRVAFDLAPPLRQGFTSSRQLRALAARGTCWMVKVALRTDETGRHTHVITHLDFLGFEPYGLDAYNLN